MAKGISCITEGRGKCITTCHYFLDNMAAIKVSKDPKFHSKSKHIVGRCHYIRGVINRLKSVRLVYLPSTSMVAEPLTKPLSQELFSKHVRDMGLQFID